MELIERSQIDHRLLTDINEKARVLFKDYAGRLTKKGLKQKVTMLGYLYEVQTETIDRTKWEVGLIIKGKK